MTTSTKSQALSINRCLMSGPYGFFYCLVNTASDTVQGYLGFDGNLFLFIFISLKGKETVL